MSKIKVTETILRDTNQVLLAARMTIDEMLPFLNDLDKVGYYSVEAWGGSTFDACLRYLNEDPWERLRTIKKNMPKTKLQMLFRGQNMLGYRQYADDVVDYFVKKSIDNGVEILRVFDALNDIRNLETSIKSAKSCKAHVQGAICYAVGEPYTEEYYADFAKKLVNLGADSVCLKDTAGILKPFDAYNIVKAIKEKIKKPVQIHSHNTAGMASMSLLKAIEAGADSVDTNLAPMAVGAVHTATETIVKALEGTEYDTGLSLEKIRVVSEKVEVLKNQYLEDEQIDPKKLGVNEDALYYGVPANMLSNLVLQLKQAGKEELLDKVLEEVPEVRKDCGMPPLFTPVSQIIGTQSVFNVIMGERYKQVTNDFKSLIMGEYGHPPVQIENDFVNLILGDTPVITGRVADSFDPELDRFRRELPLELVEQDEDVLSYAQFGDVAIDFFKVRRDDKYGIDSEHADHEQLIHPI